MNTEIPCRERHLSKYTTRIAERRLDALFVRNIEFRGMNDKLSGANQSDNGENTNGYSEIFFSVITQGCAYLTANAFGDIASATATACGVLLFQNTGSENNRINNLYNCPLIGIFYAIMKSEISRR